MKYCPKCKVSLNDENEECILCNGKVKKEEVDSVFPYVPNIYKQYNTFFRVLVLIALICSCICVFFNVILPFETKWSIFVILGFICLFVLLKISITKRYNLPKRLVTQVIIISLLSLLWDYLTGWHLWSTTYVIPIICSVTSIDMVIVAKVLKLYIEDYIIYSISIAILGLVPIIFILCNLTTTIYLSYICIFLNLLSFVLLIVLKWDDVLRELKRRFHI